MNFFAKNLLTLCRQFSIRDGVLRGRCMRTSKQFTANLRFLTAFGTRRFCFLVTKELTILGSKRDTSKIEGDLHLRGKPNCWQKCQVCKAYGL